MFMSRLVMSFGIVVFAAACTTTPTSPSRQMAEVDAAAALTGGAAAQANSGKQSGVANIVPGFEDGAVTFAYGQLNGVWGRFVTLTNAISGTNFEPGTCHPGVDPASIGVPSRCVVFGSGPGQFTRSRPGNTAFTTCIDCTIGGRTGNVTLKISYPPATPPQFPAGFTKFTFQDGTGGLRGLRGQGTLDFSDLTASFDYHFVR
jgi:hypothetical protein